MHPNQISKWKQDLILGASGIFTKESKENVNILEEEKDKLLRTSVSCKLRTTG